VDPPVLEQRAVDIASQGMGVLVVYEACGLLDTLESGLQLGLAVALVLALCQLLSAEQRDAAVPGVPTLQACPQFADNINTFAYV
jgi:hypothetical protein